MKKLRFVFVFFIIFSCSEKKNHLDEKEFELTFFKNNKELLIIFPGFGETNVSVQNESNLINKAIENNISILFFKVNNNLFFSKEEKKKYSELLLKVIKKNNIAFDNLFIGGFSSGGNLALQLGNYLSSEKKIFPKGIFIIDSPVDLEKLYYSSKKNLLNGRFKKESDFLLTYLEVKLGKPKEGFKNYKKSSPYLCSINYIENLSSLKKTEILIYTEPALAFNKEKNSRDFEDLNAFSLEKMNSSLNKFGINSTYITTKNRGYRKNGNRNPHSWSILDEQRIIEWIKRKK